MRTLYSTYYGLTEKVPSWDDSCPFEPLRDIECRERAFVASTGLVRINFDYSIPDLADEPKRDEMKAWMNAPFEIFKGEGFEIISRRYA